MSMAWPLSFFSGHCLATHPSSPQQLSPAPPGLGRPWEAGTGDKSNSAASRAGVAFWVRLRFTMARLLANCQTQIPGPSAGVPPKTVHKLSLASGAGRVPANGSPQARSWCGASHPSQAGLHCDAILTPGPSRALLSTRLGCCCWLAMAILADFAVRGSSHRLVTSGRRGASWNTQAATVNIPISGVDESAQESGTPR